MHTRTLNLSLCLVSAGARTYTKAACCCAPSAIIIIIIIGGNEKEKEEEEERYLARSTSSARNSGRVTRSFDMQA